MSVAYSYMMKQTLLLLSLFLVCLATPLFAQSDWQMVWSDEFDYRGLPDPDKWTYDTGGHGWGNHELQFYTAKDTANAVVRDGKLIITARQEKRENMDYTSARLLSRGRQAWQYGRFEISAKLPAGRGTWPALWMLPDLTSLDWPRDGEIDIMEHVGFDPGVVHGTVHTEAYNHTKGTQVGKQTRVEDFDKAFHQYAIEWTPDQITWLIDGKKYHSFGNEGNEAAWPFDKPFYLILNIAVGGDWGGAQGVDESIWPQQMEVDYVRVYQQQ
jgi:beta-glucanase (GH16 family)